MRILIDANILYPTVLRGITLDCAGAGLFAPRWSARILEEWALAAAKLSPEQEVIARGEVAAVQARFPRALVTVPGELAARLWLPDPNDVHVLAAAIAGHCDGILTMNARDFPRNILAEEGLQRFDPDNFLLMLRARDEAGVTVAVDRAVAELSRLSGEDWDRRRILRKLRLNRLARAIG